MYIVISGGGKIGEYLAKIMLSSGNEVAIIEENIHVADNLSENLEGQFLIIGGDGCDVQSQEDAGIRQADVFVSTTGQDDDNLVACEIANRVFKVPRCIARVNSPKNMRIFNELGIEAVSSTTLIAKLIQEEAMLGSMSAVSSMIYDQVGLCEITVPRMREHDNETGVLAEAIEVDEGVRIVAVSRKNEVEVVGPTTRVFPGDKVVVAADIDMFDDARASIRLL